MKFIEARKRDTLSVAPRFPETGKNESEAKIEIPIPMV
jgi:hypothetical protein